MRLQQDAIRAFVSISLAAGTALAQGTVPPDTLVLKAKVRDFREINNTGAAPTHPHFYGMAPHGPGCSSQENGGFAVLEDIDTTGRETAAFKGDKRGPRLNAAMPARMMACFEPAARFTDWYEDRGPDTNRSFLIDLRFSYNAATGVYTYSNGNFFPLDNGMPYQALGPSPTYGHLLTGPSFGVESSLHNYGFTLEFHTDFTYQEGKNQTFNFQGDDDVWVFINGKRVIDLGGPHPAQNASVILDNVAAALGLADGAKYPLDFFFAERHTSTSSLIITTSLELRPLPPLSPPILEPGRAFLDTTRISITHPDPGAVIHYTLDGSAPTAASPVYAGPIRLSATATVKAMAVKSGFLNSAVVQETYTRLAPSLPAVVADPKGIEFVSSVAVTLTVPGVPDAVIRYTLDGSDPTASSPVYSNPLVLTGTTVLKAQAYKAEWLPGPVAEERYRRLALPLRGVYVDENGDGRIDMAVIRLDLPVSALPASISLQDPFARTESTFPGSTLFPGADPSLLVVRFGDKPFTAGTGFPVGNYGKVPGTDGYSPTPFPISDSAGPVILKAVSTAAGSLGEKPYIDVTFSEPLDPARLNLDWPFDIIRNGSVTGDPIVTGVGPVDGKPDTWRWILDPGSTVLPVYIDSLALAGNPLVHDIAGVSGLPGLKRVPVEGAKPVLADTIQVRMSRAVSDLPIQGGLLNQLPPKEGLIAALAGPDGALTCLTCKAGTEGLFVNTPEWVVRARHPLVYRFRIYDNLGQHVATAVGAVSAEMLDKASRDAEGYRLVRFRWLPAGIGKRQAGTGAYVLKGLVDTDRSKAPRGGQGEPIELAPGRSEVLLTFGFLRK